MARTYWTDEALRHIAEIYRHNANDSPQNAEKFINALMDSVETQLSLSADVSRVSPELQNRDKREIIFRRYRVLYTVSDDRQTAYITQVQHGAKPL